MSLEHASTPTPSPGDEWQRRSTEDRLALVQDFLRAQSPSLDSIVTVSAARQNGQIMVTLADSMPPDKRGTFLLDLEESLKKAIDPGLVLWLEPLGDRNSLRKLRGIEVKV